MKATGLVRRTDHLGRLVIPKKLRAAYDISVDQEMEIYVENECVIIRKHLDKCYFCNGFGELVTYKDRSICHNCIKQMYEKSCAKAV